MVLSYFDIVVIILILLLGLKGIINGFFKELFGLVGIVGGIFIASRVAKSVGEILSNIVFKFESSSAINFSGFLTTLLLFWLFMIGVGTMFQKLSSASGLGAVDRIFGFVFSASKFFFIASVIIYATHNVKAIKINLDKIMKDSLTYPVFVEVGSMIMKLDSVSSAKESITNELENSSMQIMQETSEIINKSQNLPKSSEARE